MCVAIQTTSRSSVGFNIVVLPLRTRQRAKERLTPRGSKLLSRRRSEPRAEFGVVFWARCPTGWGFDISLVIVGSFVLQQERGKKNEERRRKEEDWPCGVLRRGHYYVYEVDWFTLRCLIARKDFFFFFFFFLSIFFFLVFHRRARIESHAALITIGSCWAPKSVAGNGQFVDMFFLFPLTTRTPRRHTRRAQPLRALFNCFPTDNLERALADANMLMHVKPPWIFFFFFFFCLRLRRDFPSLLPLSRLPTRKISCRRYVGDKK